MTKLSTALQAWTDSQVTLGAVLEATDAYDGKVTA